MNLLIKQACSWNIQEINDLMYHSLSYWDYSEDQLKKMMELYEIVEDYLEKNYLYLAYQKEKFVGFFSFINSNEQKNELDYFMIRKELIGLGHGRNMWEACCEKARLLGMKNFLIMSTPNAANFYYRMGAKQIGSRSSQIRPGVLLPLLIFRIPNKQN